MTTLAAGLSWIDLEFLGRRHAIATGVVQSSAGVALIDPGPSTCLATLQASLQGQGVSLADVTHILLTHIHLDHAGATGTIVQGHPRIRVVVHGRGAPHLVDPTKLMQSAARLWPTEMDRLWGECRPVPAANLEVVEGGEVIAAGGRSFEVAYTPGHASHHVSYFDPSSGVAFVGDTGGMTIEGGTVLAPTPPPDIDVELWSASVARVEQWAPSTIFLAHFGPVIDVRPHLQTLIENLASMAALVRASLEGEGSDDERRLRFAADLRRTLRRQMTDDQIAAYELSAPFDLLWLGLARYWRKGEKR